MSRYGNCFENALIERFRGVLKNELMYYQDYKTTFEVISDITKYIEFTIRRLDSNFTS